MLIIRRLNCIDAASGIVLSVSGRPVHRLGGATDRSTGRPLTEWTINRCCINTVPPPDDEYIMLETCRGM